MRKTISRLGLLVALLALGMELLGASAAGETRVRVRPGAGSYQAGQQIAVEVFVEDVADLYGADVQLAFDATRLVVLDANPSKPGVQVQPRDDLLSPDLVLSADADNVAGTVRYVMTQLNPSQPVSGSGVLFSLTLEASAEGPATVAIQQLTLTDRDGIVIPATAQDAAYWVGTLLKVYLPRVSRR